jgi:hypothetical protein
MRIRTRGGISYRLVRLASRSSQARCRGSPCGPSPLTTSSGVSLCSRSWHAFPVRSPTSNWVLPIRWWREQGETHRLNGGRRPAGVVLRHHRVRPLPRRGRVLSSWWGIRSRSRRSGATAWATGLRRSSTGRRGSAGPLPKCDRRWRRPPRSTASSVVIGRDWATPRASPPAPNASTCRGGAGGLRRLLSRHSQVPFRCVSGGRS